MASTESPLRASESKSALIEQIERYEEELRVEEVGEVQKKSLARGGESRRASLHWAIMIDRASPRERRISEIDSPSSSALCASSWRTRASKRLVASS